MSPIIVYFGALLLAAVGQIEARGRSLACWAVILVCIGLLWGVLTNS